MTRVVAIPGDVRNEEHRRALAGAARGAGGLDALVNNASILGPSPQPALLDYPLDALEEVYRANTLAPLALIQAARSELKPGARIINVTSDAAAEAYEGWGGYGSSKAASSSSPTSSQPRTRICASTGWTRATCAPGCNRRRFRERTSATGRSRRRAFRACSSF